MKLLQVRNGQLGGGWGFRGLANERGRCKMEKCGLGNMVVARTGSRAANIPCSRKQEGPLGGGVPDSGPGAPPQPPRNIKVVALQQPHRCSVLDDS